MTPTTLTLTLSRPHRFAVGDLVRHVDDIGDQDPGEVVALTLSVSDGVAYPTYTLLDRWDDSEIEGVPCNDDLTAARR